MANVIQYVIHACCLIQIVFTQQGFISERQKFGDELFNSYDHSEYTPSCHRDYAQIDIDILINKKKDQKTLKFWLWPIEDMNLNVTVHRTNTSKIFKAFADPTLDWKVIEIKFPQMSRYCGETDYYKRICKDGSITYIGFNSSDDNSNQNMILEGKGKEESFISIQSDKELLWTNCKYPNDREKIPFTILKKISTTSKVHQSKEQTSDSISNSTWLEDNCIILLIGVSLLFVISITANLYFMFRKKAHPADAQPQPHVDFTNRAQEGEVHVYEVPG